MTLHYTRGSVLGVVSGAGWANTQNLTDGAGGTNPATNAQWPSSVPSATAYFEVSGFNVDAIPLGSTINSVSLTLRHRVATAPSGISSISCQAFRGASPVGSSVACTSTGSVHNDTGTIGVSLADLQAANFKARATCTRNTGLIGTEWQVDYLDVIVDYTEPPSNTAKGLRYPLGTHLVSHNAIKNLADDIDAKLPLPDTGWIYMQLTGGWTHLDVRPCQYRRLGGVVRLRGFMSNASDTGMNVAFFNMPVGFRWEPTVAGNCWHVPCMSAGAFGAITGTNNFDLTAMLGNKSWVELEPVNWVADQ